MRCAFDQDGWRSATRSQASEDVLSSIYDLKIDAQRRRLITTWGRAATDETLMAYQKSVWSDPAVQGFDELIDFRALEKIEVSSAALEAVAGVAASMDDPGQKSRFAIVVGNTLSYGLSRMYESFRGLQPSSAREVMVFMSLDEALAWLDAPR